MHSLCFSVRTLAVIEAIPGIVVLAVFAAALWFLVQIVGVIITFLRETKTKVPVITPLLMTLALCFLLTLLFGIPSFYVVMSGDSEPADKERAMIILKWLLGGWGLGGGSTLIHAVVTRGRAPKAKSAPKEKTESAAKPE